MTQRAKMMTGLGVGAVLVAVGAGALLLNRPAQAGSPESVQTVDGRGQLVTVYRSPTCGCCKAWEDHLRENGYTVESVEMMTVDGVKDEHAVPRPLRSCHTAIVDGYVVEGHVPAADIARLLEERPDIHGLAVPGMPAGSPGMAQPGQSGPPFEVFAFSEGGSAEVWAVR